MNDIQLAKVREILTNSEVLKALKKEFDYSFETQISEVDGKLKLQFIGTDSNAEYMTLGDVSALLQMDRTAIRQMTEARAQASTVNPLPFIRIGKNLRFKRSDIVAWLERKQGESAVLPPVKGKIKRTK
jgi:predicted DNA-binding transcriptional regulator AlpA